MIIVGREVVGQILCLALVAEYFFDDSFALGGLEEFISHFSGLIHCDFLAAAGMPGIAAGEHVEKTVAFCHSLEILHQLVVVFHVELHSVDVNQVEVEVPLGRYAVEDVALGEVFHQDSGIMEPVDEFPEVVGHGGQLAVGEHAEVADFAEVGQILAHIVAAAEQEAAFFGIGQRFGGIEPEITELYGMLE